MARTGVTVGRMRVLLACSPSRARLHTLVPLGWALRTGGHETQVAGPTAFTGEITRTGFVAVPAGESDVDDLRDYAELWRPGLVLWDAAFPAAAEVAHAVGAVAVRVLGPYDDDPGPDPGAGPVEVNLLPTSLRPGGTGVRFVPYAGPEEVPAWLRRPPRRRRVLVAPGVPGPAVAGLVESVRGADVEVVCAAEVPEATRIPGNVRVLWQVPVLPALAGCVAVVHDGDPGLAMAAVAAGLPQLAVGRTWLAGRIAAAGAGLLAGTVDKAVLDALVHDPAHTAAAAALAAEVAAAPSPREAVPGLVGRAG